MLRLSDIGVERDPGTEWHPRPDKGEARDEHGDLRDLTNQEVAQHLAKPEALGVEAARERQGSAAEDSQESPPGMV